MAKTYHVIKRNVATGGRVVAVERDHRGVPVTHHSEWDARARAGSINAREDREGRNVCWTIREVER